jgi:hypothetical protein
MSMSNYTKLQNTRRQKTRNESIYDIGKYDSMEKSKYTSRIIKIYEEERKKKNERNH